jgi:DNA-binding NtrC family response regulator
MAGRLPDAVITDLRMLDGSGYWLLDQIRQLHPELLQRTMIVTGDRHRSRALELGCPVLEKPVDLKALLETLDRILPEPAPNLS